MYQHAGYFLVTILLFIACKQKQEGNISIEERPIEIEKVETLNNGQREYTGIVKASTASNLAFKLSGKITEINVQTGQQITKGSIIARIEDRDYQLQLATAKQNHQTAKAIYKRYQRLFSEQAISMQNLEIAQADYLQATEALKIAQHTINQTILRAPYDGFVENKYVDPFDEIQAGQAIIRLVNPSELEVHFILPETAYDLLQSPRNFNVTFDSKKGKRFTAAIKEYVYVANGFGIPVILHITDPQFHQIQKQIYPGFSCKVGWEAQKK